MPSPQRKLLTSEFIAAAVSKKNQIKAKEALEAVRRVALWSWASNKKKRAVW
jgi:hypothetical protein